jgi:hypothetical protein
MYSALKGTLMIKSPEEKKKQPYDRPMVTRFPLRPEEAVLGFCKSTGAGPGRGVCDAVFCKTPGS